MCDGDADGGLAMVSAIFVSATALALTGVAFAAVSSGVSSSTLQRELYEARSAGRGALEYLYAHLDHNPEFFDSIGAADPPEEYGWIKTASSSQPDVAADSDWVMFGNGAEIETCATHADPCWSLRFVGDGDMAAHVIVDAVVRFGCRSEHCSSRRFRQHLYRIEHDPAAPHQWMRSGLAELGGSDRLSAP